MIRKHLPSIVYLTLLVAAALPVGAITGSANAPLWLTITLIVITSIAIAVGIDPLTRLILRWFDDRALVREYTRRGPQ
ncbi:hypothetical protein ACIOKA_37710 [Streptomyces anulatus]